MNRKSLRRTLKTLIVAVFAAITLHAAQAYELSPSAQALLQEIDAQFFAQTNSGEPDKKLVTTLRKSRSLIDRASTTNMISRLKAVGAIAKSIGRTSLADEFAAEIEAALNADASALQILANDATERLAGVLPGKLATAAQKKLDKFLTNLDLALASTDYVTVAKLLGKAARSYGAVSKALARAEDAPVGGQMMEARVNGKTFRALPERVNLTGAYTPATRIVVLTGTTQLSRTLLASLTINISAVDPGTTTRTIGPGQTAFASYQVFGLGAGTGIFNSTGGTITITVNPTQKVMFGTFEITADGNTRIENGSFLVEYP